MAAFGFLLALVGLDPQSSIQRFTSGSCIWEGISVVPVWWDCSAVPRCSS